MASYLITGCTRGLGLALAGLFAVNPDVSKVIATGRRESDALKKLISESNGKVAFVELDVTSQESTKKAAAQVEELLGEKGLDVLINNVGWMPYTPDGIETMDNLNEVFHVNVTSVHYVTVAFLPLLRKGSLKKVVNM